MTSCTVAPVGWEGRMGQEIIDSRSSEMKHEVINRPKLSGIQELEWATEPARHTRHR